MRKPTIVVSLFAIYNIYKHAWLFKCRIKCNFVTILLREINSITVLSGYFVYQMEVLNIDIETVS